MPSKVARKVCGKARSAACRWARSLKCVRDNKSLRLFIGNLLIGRIEILGDQAVKRRFTWP